MGRWRIVFMGTPDFAVPALQALIHGPDKVVGVFTQPDKPAGRGKQLTPPPVKRVALEHGLPVFQPFRFKGNGEALQQLVDLKADLAVVAAFGQILPRDVLYTPVHGCVNIHASFLPRWRGAAPIHRALLAGDSATGITIMQMDEGLDTGPILLQRLLPLESGLTGGQLHDRLAAVGARMIVEAVEGLKNGIIHPSPQPEEGVTYAKKLEKAEARIDWSLPASELFRRIMAFNPWPGAETLLQGDLLKLFNARVGDGKGRPGDVLTVGEQGLEVACGEGSLFITELQSPGKRRLPAEDWLRGRAVAPGEHLG